jgi:hypothetical protein
VRRGRGEQGFTLQQIENAMLDFVADGAGFLERTALGVEERPVLAAEAGNVGALVATAHGEEHGGGARELLGELLRRCVGEVDADLAHDVDHAGMDPLGGLGACRDSARQGRVGQLIEEGSGHLRAAGVVDAGEDVGSHQLGSAVEQAQLAAACGLV